MSHPAKYNIHSSNYNRLANFESDDSIDAVYTWVDGSDPLHNEKRMRYQNYANIEGIAKDANASTRFNESGELWYSIHLLRKNCPWIRNIFLITDDQRPEWLTEKIALQMGVEVIDHKIIFSGYEKYLPTFNSRSIEAMMDRIPGLANRFIYFNDDILLVKPVSIETYFDDFIPLMRGRWLPKPRLLMYLNSWLRRLKMGRYNTDGLVGLSAEKGLLKGLFIYSLSHTPHPINKDDYTKCIDEFKRENIIKFRFRHRSQIKPTNLYANQAISAGKCKSITPDLLYLSTKMNKLHWMEGFRFLRHDESPRHLCVQSLELMPNEVLREFQTSLDKILNQSEEVNN